MAKRLYHRTYDSGACYAAAAELARYWWAREPHPTNLRYPGACFLVEVLMPLLGSATTADVVGARFGEPDFVLLLEAKGPPFT